jgi:type II secretory pathway predicted ATPase ExeA
MTSLEKHFGLASSPFPRAAQDAALLRHAGLEDVLHRLHFSLGRDSISLLVAESGCGKSTAIALFARSLDAASHFLITITLTTVGPFGLLASICAAAGLRARRFKSDTAAILLSHLRGLPKRTVLLVDEAHLLPDDSLEDLRLLSADDFDRRSPFALVLIGQPLLRDRLAEPRHYSLSQRVATPLRLRPLSETELVLFLDRHMKAAGAKTSPFTPDAAIAIFHHSRGIPRLAQNVALAAMLVALESSRKTVDDSCVKQAVLDLEA